MTRVSARLLASLLLSLATLQLPSVAHALTPEEICATDPAALLVVANEDFVGTTGNDLICGTEFDDVIDGGAGDDTIYSFEGDDTITSGDGNDTVDAGEGSDTVDGDAGNDLITLGEGDDYAEGGTGADKLWGGDGADSLIGDAGNDWADGGIGDDEIKLDAGDDYALGGPGADLLLGGDGRDALYAQAGSDSIDGGAGADTIDGGVGAANDRDYCVKDATDTQKRCFYDSKAPTLNSVAIFGAKTFDTSSSSQILTVRANVRDAGSGVTSAGLTFTRLNSKGQPIGTFIYANWNVWSPNCADGNTPVPSSATMNTGCLLTGTDLNGIYEFKVQLPKYLAAGTYILSNAWLTDASANTAGLDYATLKAKKLAINFKQTGVGDDAGPTLRSISVATRSVDTSESPQIINLRFALSDGLAGIQSAWLIFNYQTKSTSSNQFLMFNWYNNSSDNSTPLSLCPNGADTPGLNSTTACAVSGTLSSAVIEAKALLPAFSASGTYLLTAVTTRDFAGNTRNYTVEHLKKLKLAVSFKQTGPGDAIAPTLKEVQVVTPTVDTGSGAQVVTVKVRMVDAVSGVKSFYLNFTRKTAKFPYANVSGSVQGSFWGDNLRWENGVQVQLTNGNCTQDGLHATEPDTSNPAFSMPTACRISGTKNSGWYEIKMVMPAHSAAGTYELLSINSSDYANNQSSWWHDKLVKLKLNKSFKNG